MYVALALAVLCIVHDKVVTTTRPTVREANFSYRKQGRPLRGSIILQGAANKLTLSHCCELLCNIVQSGKEVVKLIDEPIKIVMYFSFESRENREMRALIFLRTLYIGVVSKPPTSFIAVHLKLSASISHFFYSLQSVSALEGEAGMVW